jgi:hypothetical protein
VYKDATSLAIIRVWLEPESASPLRADVRIAPDVLSGFESTTTLTDVDAVCEIVRGWLESTLGRANDSLGSHRSLP